MASRVQTIERPDKEQDATWIAWHNRCSETYYQARKAAGKDADIPTNELRFPVGTFGAGMPANTPFIVDAFCENCNTVVKGWFSWHGNLILI